MPIYLKIWLNCDGVDYKLVSAECARSALLGSSPINGSIAVFRVDPYSPCVMDYGDQDVAWRDRLPRWFHDSMLREMKLAEYRRSQTP